MHNNKLVSRTRQVYLAIVLLGVLLAVGVYGLAASVQSKARKYMETDLVIFSQVQQIGMLLSEQERILYEYYATEESSLYEVGYLQNFNQLNNILNEMAGAERFTDTVTDVSAHLLAASEVAGALHENLMSSQTQWNLSRTQLEQISQHRRAVLPLLKKIEMATNRSVSNGYLSIIKLLEITVWVVALFSLGIAAISFYLGRYAARYIRLSTENETLALFPKRNPNPVIRIDAKGKLLYANPAADDLIAQLYPTNQLSMASFPAPLS